MKTYGESGGISSALGGGEFSASILGSLPPEKKPQVQIE
jgi:hypothetical protein